MGAVLVLEGIASRQSVGGTGRTVVGTVLTSPGSGYTSPPSIILSTNGTQPVFGAVLGTESLATIVLDTGGSGYTAANPSVSIVPSDGNGSGGAATATVAGAPTPGPVTAIALNASAVSYFGDCFQGVSSTPGTFALSFTGGGGSSGGRRGDYR